MDQPSSESNGAQVEPGTEVLKVALRGIISTHRREQREALVNKNRVALGEIREDSLFTPEFVATKARALAKKPLSVNVYRQLQNALIQNEENVGAFLQVGGSAISGLVRDMSCCRPELQLSAANCCCNLALGNAKARSTLAKGVSTYLLILLEGCNRPMMEVALWTIGNMVSGSIKVFNLLHAQDALKHLITLWKDCDESILPAVAYASVHYLYTGCQGIKKDEKQELARVVAHRKFQYEETNFLWLVALLSSVEESTSYFNNAVPTLVDLLHEAVDSNSHSISRVTAYVRTIGNLVCESTGNVAFTLLDNEKHSEKDLCTLLEKLLHHQHTHIRHEAIWLIGNLYNHNEQKVHSRTCYILSQLSHTELAISSLM